MPLVQNKTSTATTTTQLRGGKGSRNKRRVRRSAARKPFGPEFHIVTQSYENKEVSGHDLGSTAFYNNVIHIGNKHVFAGDWAKLRMFHEFKISRADITIMWTLIKTTSWTEASPESCSGQALSFIEDWDAENKASLKLNWDTLAGHPETRLCFPTSATRKTTRHVWRPTEPTDQDWRLTNNDGICHLYLCASHDDAVETHTLFHANVRIKFHFNVRGLDIEADKSVLRTFSCNRNRSESDESSSSQVIVDIQDLNIEDT